jgi:acetyl-CoA acyltransferase
MNPLKGRGMNGSGRRVAIIDGCRTPFAKSGTDFANLSSTELGKIAVRDLIARTELDVELIDHMIYGTVIQSVKEPNIAREVALGSGIPPKVPAFTVGAPARAPTRPSPAARTRSRWGWRTW